MSQTPTIERRVSLTEEQEAHLRSLAHSQNTSEDQLIGQAVDVLFRLINQSDEEEEDWSLLATESFHEVWDNDEDAIYDNWKELYGVSTG